MSMWKMRKLKRLHARDQDKATIHELRCRVAELEELLADKSESGGISGNIQERFLKRAWGILRKTENVFVFDSKT